MSLGLTVIACIGTRFGWGRHLGDIPFKNFTPMFLLSWLSELFFTAAASLMKISILFFYLRLAVDKTYRVVIYCTIGTILAYMIAYIFVIIFVCLLHFGVIVFPHAVGYTNYLNSNAPPSTQTGILPQRTVSILMFRSLSMVSSTSWETSSSLSCRCPWSGNCTSSNANGLHF